MIGHLIVRLVSIVTGFVLAVIAAALFLSIGVVRDVVGPYVEYHSGVAAEGWLVALYSGWRGLSLEPDLSINQGVVIVLLAAGFCAGIVYWLIAGRSAGRWLDGM